MFLETLFTPLFVSMAVGPNTYEEMTNLSFQFLSLQFLIFVSGLASRREHRLDDRRRTSSC